jgi:DNA-binding response OmpR family regulator
MALIVVCEDDASTRLLIKSVLSKAGHQVETFDDGEKGLVRLLEGDVELLISDVQMPGTDGFALVSHIRAHQQLLDLPCILLTALAERAHMRTGMTSGADDYVTKPFQPQELMDAVNSQLQRAMQLYIMHSDETQRIVNQAVGERTRELMVLFEKRLQKELQLRWVRSDTKSSELRGSMVACAMAHHQPWLESLDSTQLADLARHFYSKVADTATLFNAEYLQFIGHGLLIAFDSTTATATLDHTGRALKLIQSMPAIRDSMRAYINTHLNHVLDAQNLPAFVCALALHEGVLGLGKLDGVAGGIDQLLPVGPDVLLVTRLLHAGQTLQWPVVYSQRAVDALARQNTDELAREYADIQFGLQKQRIYRAE